MKQLAILAIAALSAGCSNIQPLVIATHLSDPSDAGISDTTVDFIGAGATAQFGDFQIDAAVGRKAINCSMRGSCPSSLGAMGTIRWQPRAPR